MAVLNDYFDFTSPGNYLHRFSAPQDVIITTISKLPAYVSTLTKSIIWKVKITDSDAKVRASSNAGAGNCLDQEWKIEGGIKKWLILDFDTGPGYNWNAFEGCCVCVGSYYGVWPKHKAMDVYDMLKNHLSCQQYWVYLNEDKEIEYICEEMPTP